MREAGRTDPLAHLAARPRSSRGSGQPAAVLAEWTGARIHILHISSAEELRPLADAKARGRQITGETCPHYLFLSADDYDAQGGVIRINPPVREARNQKPLWQALVNARSISSRPIIRLMPGEKTRNDIWTVDCGFPGVQTQMPLMLSQLTARQVSISDYVRWSAYNPARIWASHHTKARSRSEPSDLAIVDLGLEMVLDDAELQSVRRFLRGTAGASGDCPFTPWSGAGSSCAIALCLTHQGWGRSVHTIQTMRKPGRANTDATMRAIVRAP